MLKRRRRIIAAVLLCLLASGLVVARRQYYERTKHFSRVLVSGLSPSPDGSRIALAMRVMQSVNVYTLDVDTGELTGLAYGLPQVCCVTWLPSGSAVFVGTSLGKWEVDLAGSKAASPAGPVPPSFISGSGRFRVVTSGPYGQVLTGIRDGEQSRLLPVRHDPGFRTVGWVGDRLLAFYLEGVPHVDQLDPAGGPPTRLWTFNGRPLLAPGAVGPPDAPQAHLAIGGSSAFCAPVPYQVRQAAGRDPIAVRIDMDRGRVCEVPLGVSRIGLSSSVAASPDGRWLAVRCSGVDSAKPPKGSTRSEADLLLLFEATSGSPGMARRLCVEGGMPVFGDVPASSWSPDSKYLLAPGIGVVDLAALGLVGALPGRLYDGNESAIWVRGNRLVSYLETGDEPGIWVSGLDSRAARVLLRTRPRAYDDYRQSFAQRLLRAVGLRP